MPTAKDYTLWTYSDEQDGQIAAGTVTSPWFNVAGVSKLLLLGAFTTGTTTLDVEQSRDGVTVDAARTGIAAAGLVDGVEANVAYEFARVKIQQSGATTTNAELAVKGSD